jgi:hypothetical protein
MLPPESSENVSSSEIEPPEQPELQVLPNEVNQDVPPQKVDETQFLNALREQLQEASNHRVPEKEDTANAADGLKDAFQNESVRNDMDGKRKDTAFWKKSVKGLFTLFKMFINPF